MSAASDPFAVSFYDPAALPAVGADLATYSSDDLDFVQLCVDEESAKVSLQHIAAHDYLTTKALAAYEPGQWGVFDPTRLLPDGVTEANGDLEELAQATVPVEATDAQKQERRARLSAAIKVEALNDHEWLRANSRRALVHALELDAKMRKRDEASKIAAIEGRHLANGLLAEAALKATAAELGCSPGKVRPLRAFPEYLARRDIARQCAAKTEAGRGFAVVIRDHAADGWFTGETTEDRIASANRVAAHIITLMREGTRGKTTKGKRPLMPPVHLRWDALNLVEGFAKRRIPLTPVACAMVDQALGLFDSDGVPVAAPFVGIRKRDTFLAAAAYEGTEDGADIVSAYDLRSELQNHGLPTASPKQLKKWRGRETYQSLVTESRTAEDWH